MSDETYNGHTNRDTWLASLHYNNDQGAQSLMLETVKAYRFSVVDAASAMEDTARSLLVGFDDELVQEHRGNDVMILKTYLSDVVNQHLARVDWESLAKDEIAELEPICIVCEDEDVPAHGDTCTECAAFVVELADKTNITLASTVPVPQWVAIKASMVAVGDILACAEGTYTVTHILTRASDTTATVELNGTTTFDDDQRTVSDVKRYMGSLSEQMKLVS